MSQPVILRKGILSLRKAFTNKVFLKVIALCEHWFNATLAEPTVKELRTPRVLMFTETKSTRETRLLEEKYNCFSAPNLTLSALLYF